MPLFMHSYQRIKSYSQMLEATVPGRPKGAPWTLKNNE